MRLKKILGIMVVSVLIMVSITSDVVYGANDYTALQKDFYVDLSTNKKVKWYETITTNVKINGKIVGVVSTNIGTTRTKKEYSGFYYDTLLIENIVKGKKGSALNYGYCENLKVYTTAPSGSKLWSHSPVNKATSTSYNIGVGINSDGEKSISGSKNFTKNALEINDLSDTSSNYFCAEYDYLQHSFRWDWKLSKYSYYESTQISAYTLRTKKSKYDNEINIYAKFESWDSEPGFWAGAWKRYGSSTTTIEFVNQY